MEVEKDGERSIMGIDRKDGEVVLVEGAASRDCRYFCASRAAARDSLAGGSAGEATEAINEE